MKLQKIARIFILYLLCAFGFLLGTLIEEKHYSTLEKEQIPTICLDKEVYYIEIPILTEIPTIDYDISETEEDLKEDIYRSYMDKMTLDNCEYWWHGYNIMIKNWEDQPEHITDIYPIEDLEYLYRCVETETYQADFLSKVNVANVIINRLETGKYGNTFKEVITYPNQFCYGRKNISKDTIEACAFAFEIEDTTNGALYFHSGGKTKTFNGREYIFTDAVGHHFY